MNIAFRGQFAVSYSTESHVAEALESIGHWVRRIQEGTPAADCVNQVEGADVFLWTKTPSLAARSGSLAEQAKMLDDIKARGITTVAYHLDRYFDLKRESEVGEHPWWNSDVVFSADGGNQERFKAKGVNHKWLPAALTASEVGPGKVNRQMMHDVVFVGSGGGYHPEWPWRQKLLADLTSRYRRRFAQYPRRVGLPVRGQKLNDLYASASVVVGDSIFAGACENYWSDRIYETVGRGGVLVHPFVEGLDAHFTDGEHYVAYQAGDIDSVFSAVDGLLADAERRDRLRAAGPPHVEARHTYAHRMREMLEAL